MAISKIILNGVTQMDLTSDTVAASNLIAPNTAHGADGEAIVGEATAGGGASNYVTGTFTGTTTGSAMDITLNYSGSGYPIAVMVFPSAGSASGSAYGDLVQRYAIGYFYVVRNDPTNSTSSAPAMVVSVYKNSSTNSTNYARNGAYSGSGRFENSNATSSYGTALTMRSATKMSVFIASTSYGFAANIEYTYHVIYSE